MLESTVHLLETSDATHLPADSGLWLDFGHDTLESLGLSFHTTCWAPDAADPSYFTVMKSTQYPSQFYSYTYNHIIDIARVSNYIGFSSSHYFLLDTPCLENELQMIDEAMDSLIHSCRDLFTHQSSNSKVIPLVIMPRSLVSTEQPPFSFSNESDIQPTMLKSKKLPTTVEANPVTPIPDDKPLIDLEFNEFGQLLSIVDSMSFIPEKFVKKCRRVYNLYMQNVVDNSHDSLSWKKFLLLPTVLFTVQKGNRKADLNYRLELLLEDKWNSFTFGYFMSRSFSKSSNSTKSNQLNSPQQMDIHDQRISTMAKAGEIGLIMRYITRVPGIARPSSETINLLRAKHPCDCPFEL